MADEGGEPSGGDTEQGQQRRPSERRISRASIKEEDWANLDEYGKLVKYVSTFRESGAVDEEKEDVEMRRVWYAPWRKRKVRIRRADEAQGQFPDEWLITDIREGLSANEVSVRRQRAGWNELVSEKENPIAKVLSYFRGPILYGKIYFVSDGLNLSRCVPDQLHSHGVGRSPCSRPG